MYVVAKIAVIVFAIEGALMYAFFRTQPPLSYLWLALADAFLLTAISAPFIYFWVIRPYVLQRDAAEKAHLDARLDAQEANRAKSDFLARMSHEIRTPLNAILGFSEMIKDQVLGPVGTSRYAEYAGDVHASATHLLGLIDDILDLSKIEAGRVELQEELLPVHAVVGEAIDLVALMSSDKGVALTADLDPDLPWLYADRRAVRQMLLNLLSNAIKFTPEGGEVTVRASADEGGLSLAVADTGIGIDPRDFDTVLAPFGQVKDGTRYSPQGTGLGLSLVKSMAALHGGAFVIDSAPGRGTTAALRFPPERLRAALGRTA